MCYAVYKAIKYLPCVYLAIEDLCISNCIIKKGNRCIRQYASHKKNMSKCVLPICEKPSVITSIHHAYPCAIIESRQVLDMDIMNFEKYTWDIKRINTELKVENNNVRLFEQEMGENVSCVFWRECFDDDEVVIRINHVKVFDFSRFVDVFLFDDLERELDKEDKTEGIRWNPYGYFIKKDMYSFDTRQYVYVKLKRTGGNLFAFASKDGTDWEAVAEVLQENNKKRKYVGIHAYLGRDAFDSWKAMNYVQLVYNSQNPYKGIHLDYYLFPRKNVDNSYMGYASFLDTKYDYLFEVLDCYGSLYNFITKSIKHRYYVVICLDEYFVKDRPSFRKKNYNHYNMVYGFNDEERVYYLMGYGRGNVPVISSISYDDLCIEHVTSEFISRYRYNTNDVTKYEFNKQVLCRELQEFLSDSNCAMKISKLMAGEELMWGVSIIKDLYTDNSLRNDIRDDIRISFCLQEHAKLMKERITFLYKHEYITAIDHDLLIKEIEDIIHVAALGIAQVLKGLTGKNGRDNLDLYLKEYFDKEKAFCQNLLEVLLAD